MVRQHRNTGILILVISASLILLLSCERKKDITGMDSQNSFISDSAYIHAGNHLVKNTFDTLRASLQQQISSQGFDGAITFCNEQAYPITHAYADSVTIKRAALRYRNPNNNLTALSILHLG